MTGLGWLDLRERRFAIESAEVVFHRRDQIWSVDIHAAQLEFDGELWRPYLYHQGLSLAAATPEALAGTSTSWKGLRDETYHHPELGLLCVFGHHDVYDCRLSFGSFSGGRVTLHWTGLCQVFWDEQFGEDVPLRCECSADVAVR